MLNVKSIPKICQSVNLYLEEFMFIPNHSRLNQQQSYGMITKITRWLDLYIHVLTSILYRQCRLFLIYILLLSIDVQEITVVKGYPKKRTRERNSTWQCYLVVRTTALCLVPRHKEAVSSSLWQLQSLKVILIANQLSSQVHSQRNMLHTFLSRREVLPVADDFMLLHT